ncbi:lactam utilization protein LamB [Lonsdalea iberica]|uniref:Lactam utilization protein LamB n=1 Tax=Lonsdalea iberica TaxID=1082703 RepID=A0ABX3XI90_9GAMM|nr:5-oxoprolinase subunit PxpA [Lonsdalea iberica]OSN11324.1 lactam utilization protein LamB [Lonsdalea iberica]
MTKRIDLNSDMGEDFGSWLINGNIDREIMSFISSANIAAGFHAGDPTVIRKTIEMAKYYGVAIGAHPGYRDLMGFGRRYIAMQPDELVNDIIYQLGALRELARLYQMELQHIKPHGALYMHLAQEAASAHCFVEALHRIAPDLLLYCMHGTAVWRAAQSVQHPVICEFYADRDYDLSGSIVFTRRVGALDPQQVAQKVLRACRDGVVRTVEGEDIPIVFESVCMHSDTPGAQGLLKATCELLKSSSIEITAPGKQHMF